MPIVCKEGRRTPLQGINHAKMLKPESGRWITFPINVEMKNASID